MELTQTRIVKVTAILLLLAVITQALYTALAIFAPETNRQILWGVEGLVFVLIAAFAGSALVTAKRHTLGFAAIAFCAVLNLVQVGVGVTQFGPFRAVAASNAELAGYAGAVVSLSYFLYNAAKILLSLAAIEFGMSKVRNGGRVLGSLTALAGSVAFVANTIVMMFGHDGFFPKPIAGGTGVLATLLLAICLLSISRED